MENVFLTSLTTPEVRQLFRQELETYFGGTQIDRQESIINEQPVNTKEICSFLDVTEPTLIRWRKKGKIPFLQVGSRILYQKSAVIKALESKRKG